MVAHKPGGGGSQPSPESLILAARGLLAETLPLALAVGDTTIADQTVHATMLSLFEGQSVTEIVFRVTRAGAGTPPTHFWGGIWRASTGALVAQTADSAGDAALTTLGVQSLALTAPFDVVTSAAYYVGVLSVGLFDGTTMKIQDQGDGSTGFTFGANAAFTGLQTGRTTLPSTLAFTGDDDLCPWFGCGP